MTKPVRLQLARTAGFRLQRLSRKTNGLPAVNVARPSVWGNPFRVGEAVDRRQVKRWGWKFHNLNRACADRADAAARFAACLWGDEAVHADVREHLRGKNLACWCNASSPCHADALLELANR